MVKKILSGSYITLVLFLLYAPILLLFVYSFNMSREIGIWSPDWGFDLYVKLWNNSDLMETVVNTLVLALVAGFISTVLGTMGAIGIYYSNHRVNRTMNVLTKIPMINAEVVTAISIALICTMFAFGRTYASLLIGHVVLTIPFVVLSVIPKLKQMDNNLYEAVLDLGATPTKAIFLIVIPEILPGTGALSAAGIHPLGGSGTLQLFADDLRHRPHRRRHYRQRGDRRGLGDPADLEGIAETRPGAEPLPGRKPCARKGTDLRT